MNTQHVFHKQQGFTLIEALVAFLILSVGMLGIASLQTLSLKAGSTAMYRTAAVMKVDEIIENMRANQTAIINYAAGTGDPGADNGCRQTASTAASVCTAAQIAADDILHWKNSLQTVLPANAATTASITVTAPVAPEVLSTVAVTVNWNERDADNKNAAIAMNYTVTLQI
jgi:type IV pilus assembly protein PilV